jgi:shikimate dehydrogenase
MGHPVQHSRSPMIHALFAKQTRQKVAYEAIDASPEGLETAVRGFGAAGGKGLNITVPHKHKAMELCDALGSEAEQAGAVNTITFVTTTRLRGDNTDGIGFMRDLVVNHNQNVRGARILILGAGGAARGILPPLIEAEPADLVLANRTLGRAEAVVTKLGAKIEVCAFEDLGQKRPFDIVVNATSAGLDGRRPPFPAACLAPDSFCYDLAYSLKETPFVRWALEHGARRAVQGWGMLVEQAAESFQIWRGVRPDTTAILAQLDRAAPRVNAS